MYYDTAKGIICSPLFFSFLWNHCSLALFSYIVFHSFLPFFLSSNPFPSIRFSTMGKQWRPWWPGCPSEPSPTGQCRCPYQRWAAYRSLMLLGNLRQRHKLLHLRVLSSPPGYRSGYDGIEGERIGWGRMRRWLKWRREEKMKKREEGERGRDVVMPERKRIEERKVERR